MTVTVANPSNFDRTNQTVEIELQYLEQSFGQPDYSKLKLADAKGSSVTYQITSDRKFIFQTDINAGETLTFILKQVNVHQTFKPKTYARFITERKDDFAWENDRVAFRVYGQALKPIDGPSNGIDVWYKRTDELIIDKWYKNDLENNVSYHEDHGEGLDNYKVGRSLGAGGAAPFVNDSLWLNENFVSHELLDNGPVRSTLKLTYNKLLVDGREYGETRIFSIDAGSQLTKIVQSYEGFDGVMPVAAGLVKRDGHDSIIAKDRYVIYAEPYSEKVDNVFLAMVFPDGYTDVTVHTYQLGAVSYSHVLAVCDCEKSITYYSGYGWSKAGMFPDIAVFEKYISDFAESLNVPLTVKWK
jgi:hypothetical protein